MEIVPLAPGFAAELRGIGLAEIAARADIYAAVRAAFEEHSVLLFRGQTVTDDAQLDFTRCFGPLEITKRASLGEGSHFSILTNLDADGLVVASDHRQALVARANQLWHTDSSFKATPALASVLSARVIPPNGGETEFASTRLAGQRLPDDLRARLADAFAWHDSVHMRRQQNRLSAWICPFDAGNHVAGIATDFNPRVIDLNFYRGVDRFQFFDHTLSDFFFLARMAVDLNQVQQQILQSIFIDHRYCPQALGFYTGCQKKDICRTGSKLQGRVRH